MRHFDGERAHYSGDVRRCSGTFERVIQREFYGQTYQVGVRFDY